MTDPRVHYCGGAMPDNDLFLQTIDAVYASGFDRERLPEALDSISRLLGGSGAYFEVNHKLTRRHDLLCTVGVPAGAYDPYLKELVVRNPRIPFAFRQPVGSMSWDHQILDEAEMARDPFYSEFLSHYGLRYFAAVVIHQSSKALATISVHRTRKQGHVDKREIAIMGKLCPHFQRAYDLATRLMREGGRRSALENALAWLADGVALLRADGTIAYANDAFHALARRGDGLRISGEAIEFTATEARRRFESALGTVERLGDPSCDPCSTDFPVPRNNGMPAYIVSLRPLACENIIARADVMLLVRDPLWRNTGTSQLLQEIFSLTNAEAHLAQALCGGTTTSAYAVERRVSLNTVYSHLKRIREKTGCRGVPELIRKFGEWNIPLRVN
jgi:DNA-binding CsgD family transcriptional regulator/PAS domain-containing protein